jgi:hypothetical protein
VQQILSTIASGIDIYDEEETDAKSLIPLTQLNKVLSLLVNPSVTELDCTVFDIIFSDDNRKFNNLLLKHALKNCPKISKIVFFKSFDCYKELPVKHFKQSWNNLISIKTDYVCNEDTLKLIKENFPNIESVSLYFVDETNIYYNN